MVVAASSRDWVSSLNRLSLEPSRAAISGRFRLAPVFVTLKA
jgi:hypothetical protein